MSSAEPATKVGLQGRFKPYPAYKHSGVEWLGQIPEHWEVKRLRFSLDTNPVASELRGLALDTEVSFVPMEAVGECGGLDLTQTKVLDDIGAGYTYFRDGDVVVAKITPCFENGKGALVSGLTNGIAYGTTELHVLRPKTGIDQRYLFYVSQSDGFRRLGEAEMYGAGGQKRVPESFIRNLRHTLPDQAEQRAIATFLDRETAQIDALVEKKQRLIELLQEQRTALITRSVTKGLDPFLSMKDSGVEWLGEIPAHWEVSRLGTCSVFRAGKAHEPFVDEQGSFICVNSRFISTEGRMIKFCTENLTPARKDDVLMVMSDLPNGRALAKAFYVPEGNRYAVNQRVCALSVLRDDPRFFYYQLNRSPGLLCLDDGINQTHIPNSAFTKLIVVVPPIEEQVEIKEFLDRETAKLDEVINKAEAFVQLFGELRTALISAAVTGKIDVREEAV
jgi:type I restriction enzyme S subunit